MGKYIYSYRIYYQVNISNFESHDEFMMILLQ